MSEYLIETLARSLYYQGWLKTPAIPFPIDTTAFDIALAGQLTRNGFNYGQPCQATFEVIDDAPEIAISEKDGFFFTGRISIDISCKRNSEQTHYT